MKRDRTNLENPESETGAIDGLSERSSSLLERLSAKLARHNRGAEEFALAMQMKRAKP